MASFHLRFFIFSFLFPLCVADNRTTKAGIVCGSIIPHPGGNFEHNFLKAMETLSTLTQVNNMGTVGYGQNPKVYGLAQCMGNLNSSDCFQCFKEASKGLRACHPYDSGRVYFDGCFLRYDSYNFFEEAVDNLRDKAVCRESKPPIPDYQKNEFMDKVSNLIRNLTHDALQYNGFAVAAVTGGVLNVYGLAQCWSTVDEAGCKDCLWDAVYMIHNCRPMKEGRAMKAGCYLRYSTEMFVDVSAFHKFIAAHRTTVLVGMVVASLLCSALGMLGVVLGYSVISAKREEYYRIHLSPAIRNSGMIFEYETLRKATESFHSSRKLGQGAAASVFKASLPDGNTVAVKRLFFNSRQWAEEFFNEVNLINGIKHKNLVKLLGCSIEGPESLLIYEYLHNGSLDQLLFDKKRPGVLTWQQRLDIILGIAEGLAYLHGGMLTRIIHRDIKCSNILLDENLMPKIGDFGLIRRFGADRTHISTAVAGTLGYVAPEYLVRGQLTEKADIYGFGVLVIEVVCARRNGIFLLELGSVLHTVWENYQSGTLPDSVDSRLRNKFSNKEASHVLQIALLCTQSSAKLRPSMSQVVEMLNNRDCTLPLPKQPPFMDIGVVNDEPLMRSSRMERTVSNTSTDTASTFYSAVNVDTLDQSERVHVCKVSNDGIDKLSTFSSVALE